MTGETILITRPKGDEAALTDALHDRGYRVIHEPLTEIFLHHTERQALDNALSADPDAILVTSRHGARALSLLTELRDAYLLCVGEATAHVAQSLGFTRVQCVGGHVQSLVEHVFAGFDPGTRFLYISGKHIRVDLQQVLGDQGMQVERLSVYEAIASEQLSDTVVEQLKRGQIDAVTFLSPRTAQIFTTLLTRADAQESVKELQAAVLSDAVSAALSADWKGIHTAHEATLASLVDCVDTIFHA